VKAQEARELGQRIAAPVRAGELVQAYNLLAPVLAGRTPFPTLGRIGKAVGAGPLESTNEFLDLISVDRTEGGWVVIGAALGAQLHRDLEGACNRCRDFIVAADVWYGADILGERVPGPALLAYFQTALEVLDPWREDENRWVRRAVGVAAHFWAKRSRGGAEYVPQAEALLAFLEPMFGEWDIDAVKGVGWGLKTLGKYYPDLVADWLAREIVPGQRRHRALMLRKATTYLSDEQCARALAESV
jgi:3-methyladenine DNA glycosylase AlkD